MKLPALIAAPLAWIYGLIINVRHKLFDLKILRSEEFDIPVVCVGNLTVGGTGKTPVTEFLIERLSGERRVAVLSRGYRRRTKGFVLSTPRSSVKSIGDEPKQMKMKYPDVPMAVCEKRAEGIRRLREIHPEIELVILDDAFQHRYVEPWVNILLMDYNRPVYRDRLLPWGRLRHARTDRPGQFRAGHQVSRGPQPARHAHRAQLVGTLSLPIALFLENGAGRGAAAVRRPDRETDSPGRSSWRE